MTRLIVVVGADRRQGNSVIEALLEYPDEWCIRTIIIDPRAFDTQKLVQNNVDIVKCDINSREECCRAFVGAYGVFVMNNYWDTTDQNEYQQALNLVEAARTANVQHFIASSLPHSRVLEKSYSDLSSYSIIKTEMEKYIQQLHPYSSFPHVTFIHGSFFYQNFVTFFVLGPDKIGFRYPVLAPARIPLYDVRDTGKVVRECFRQPEKWGGGQTISIVAEQLTMDEICATIRNVTGKDVDFVPLPYDEALRRLHRETIHSLRWYNDIGRTNERLAEKTQEIWPQMATFTKWIQETEWLME